MLLALSSAAVLMAAQVESEHLNEADLPETTPKWTGDIQFNVSSATGNTENTVLGGSVTLDRTYERLINNFQAGGNFASTTTVDGDGNEISETTQNNWFLQYRGEYQVGDRSFVFGRLRYEQDEFSGFDSRTNFAAGVGHTLIKTDTTELTMLAGPGYQYAELSSSDPDEDDTISSASFFFGQTFSSQIRENVTIEQALDATVTDDNTTVSNIMSLKTDLTERISSRLSYQVRHETDPPAGREATDTLLTASLGFSF